MFYIPTEFICKHNGYYNKMKGDNMSMSMESNEMCEYYESVILDMLKEYENKKKSTQKMLVLLMH